MCILREDSIGLFVTGMGRCACAYATLVQGVKAISASIEAGIDADGMLIPGLGHFEGRYRD